MNKLVYLFELDSVRKTDREILEGQKALYEELVGNGNTVVLTFNQLVDSRAFFCLLEDEDYAKNLVHLFEIGAIRISQFGDNRTISQYLINSLSQEREFIYSGWPLKSTQKRLLALIRRSLTYSDLTEIYDHINKIYSVEETLDLFVEVIDGIEKRPQPEDYCVCIFILRKLAHLLKTVLQLSFMHTIYIDPKPQPNLDDPECMKMNLPKFLHNALLLKPSCENKLWNEAVDVIKNLESDVFCFANSTGSIDRSVYYHAIKEYYEQARDRDESVEKKPYQYAEAIVDLCYNYQLEYSICNSSKHYNINEFSKVDEPESWISFSEDFFLRLKQLWDDTGDVNARFLLDETNVFLEYGEEKERTKISRLMSETVRILDYMNLKKAAVSVDECDPVYRYEYELRAQSRNHKNRIESNIGKRLLLTLPSIAIACGLEFAIQYLQGVTEMFIPWNSFTETLIFLAVTEFITWAISKFIPGFLSLSEAVGNIGKLIWDLILVSRHELKSYVNSCKENVSVTECGSSGAHIDFIMTEPIKRYVKLQDARHGLFDNPTEILRIENIGRKSENRQDAIKKMLRLEELYGYHFGVIYCSAYNTWVVDPIINDSDERDARPYYAYERVVPTGKNGTIAVTVHDDKLVLLTQFRHAPRKFQYAFPRGYNENRLSPLDNLANELDGEIGAKPAGEPVYLGKINPDSGLTSGSADVYLVEVDKVNTTYDEGIVKSIEITEQQFEEKIAAKRNNDETDLCFDDGFTLAAYALYKEYKGQLKV